MMSMKPGIKTTEFYISLVVSLVGPIVAILVIAGVIRADEADGLVEQLTVAVTTVGTNLVSAWAAINYARTRTEAKSVDAQVQLRKFITEAEDEEIDPPVTDTAD